MGASHRVHLKAADKDSRELKAVLESDVGRRNIDTLIKARKYKGLFSCNHTPLQIAVVAHGSMDSVRLLCESKADVNARSRGGRTALGFAVECHQERSSPIVKYLISCKADVNTEIQPGLPLIHYLYEKGGNHKDCLYMVLEAAGLDPNARKMISSRSNFLATLLATTQRDNVGQMEEKGMSVLQRMAGGRGPSRPSELGWSNEDLVHRLVAAKADVNHTFPCEDGVCEDQARSPLELAVMYGGVNMIRPLLEAKAQIFLQRGHGGGSKSDSNPEVSRHSNLLSAIASSSSSSHNALRSAVLFGEMAAVKRLLRLIELGGQRGQHGRGNICQGDVSSSRGEKMRKGEAIASNANQAAQPLIQETRNGDDDGLGGGAPRLEEKQNNDADNDDDDFVEGPLVPVSPESFIGATMHSLISTIRADGKKGVRFEGGRHKAASQRKRLQCVHGWLLLKRMERVLNRDLPCAAMLFPDIKQAVSCPCLLPDTNNAVCGRKCDVLQEYGLPPLPRKVSYQRDTVAVRRLFRRQRTGIIRIDHDLGPFS